MGIIIVIVLWIGFCILTVFVDSLYQANPTIFYVLWLAIPIGTAVFQNSKKSHHISKKTSKRIRTIAIALTVGISFWLFAHHDDIRDYIGHENIKGYHSEYYPDASSFGNVGVDIHTSHWFGRFILWVFGWGFFILCCAIPIITWKQCTRIYERLPEKNP